MDYFYVLKQGFTPEERDDAVYWIKRLGMGRFASGMMWVLQEMLGLEPQFLLMKPNAKEGRFIIDEVLKTGNMGCSDTRNWGSLKTPLSRFFFNLRRDIYIWQGIIRTRRYCIRFFLCGYTSGVFVKDC